MALLVPTQRLVIEETDQRASGRYPLARKSLTISVPDLVSIITQTVKIPHGILVEMRVSSPNIPTDTTYDIRATDQDGQDLFDLTANADNGVITTKFDTSAVATRHHIVSSIDIELDWTTALSGNTMEFDLAFHVADPIGM